MLYCLTAPLAISIAIYIAMTESKAYVSADVAGAVTYAGVGV